MNEKEYNPDIYTLVDEEGTEQTFELLDVMELDGEMCIRDSFSIHQYDSVPLDPPRDTNTNFKFHWYFALYRHPHSNTARIILIKCRDVIDSL